MRHEKLVCQTSVLCFLCFILQLKGVREFCPLTGLMLLSMTSFRLFVHGLVLLNLINLYPWDASNLI
jgi:hypothetical protein